jgi:sec-independent protein translocase protein TatB
MFGIGTWELVVILILALLLVGPDKLPGMARSIGKSLTKLRQAADEVKREIDLDGIKKDITEEIMADGELESLRRDLDLRGDIRKAMSELKDPPPLPGPDEPVAPRRDGPRTDLEAADPDRDPGDDLAG